MHISKASDDVNETSCVTAHEWQDFEKTKHDIYMMLLTSYLQRASPFPESDSFSNLGIL